MSKDLHRKYTIVCRGRTKQDLDNALHEALKRIDGGHTSGGDRGERGSFYFELTDDVPISERSV